MKLPINVAAALLLVTTVWADGRSNTASYVELLIRRIGTGSREAILELGSSGDRSVVPYLQGLLHDPDREPGGAASNAQMALAKLGETNQLNEIVGDLDDPDPVVQLRATRKLVYVNGNAAVRALAKCLFDTKYNNLRRGKEWRGPNGEPPMDKVFYEPLSHMSIRALAQLVPNPPTAPETDPPAGAVEKWQKWWEANKSKYAE